MRYLDLIKSKSINIAFIDPGIDGTGLCVYKHRRKPTGFTSEILHCKHIKPITDSGSLQQRSSEIIDGLHLNLKDQSIKIVIVEQPPQTVYNNSKLPRKHLVGKAQNVMKLFFVVGYIIAGLRERLNSYNARNGHVKIYTVIPKQWEPSKKERIRINGISEIKEWSIEHAKLLLTECEWGISNSTSVKNQNGKIISDVADAICIGERVLDKLENKKIELTI